MPNLSCPYPDPADPGKDSPVQPGVGQDLGYLRLFGQRAAAQGAVRRSEKGPAETACKVTPWYLCHERWLAASETAMDSIRDVVPGISLIFS